MNLSQADLQGLKWLETKIKGGVIAVIKADEGGATLIVDPSLLKQRTAEKQENEELYEKLSSDPTHGLYEKLCNWKTTGYCHSQRRISYYGNFR